MFDEDAVARLERRLCRSPAQPRSLIWASQLVSEYCGDQEAGRKDQNDWMELAATGGCSAEELAEMLIEHGWVVGG
jgi:hypothetical protein